jgi:cation diffusion facilitator CzcD-associated flavoprotein CzcO
MQQHTGVLIVGAGPFGLSLAAYARHHDVDHILLGVPMDFWQSNMPEGMYLRSDCDWHLDPLGVDTMDRYLATQGLTREDVEPLSRASYMAYTAWFREQKRLEAVPRLVRRLEHTDGEGPAFTATLEDGTALTADRVVIAPGYRPFTFIPEALAAIVPAECYSHTCDLVEFGALRGKRILIVGGRQSALEWAALLREAGAAAVHVSHRHPTPAFEEADWSWVPPLVDALVEDPGWYRRLSVDEKEALKHRLWAEGRLKVEPWLEPRIARAGITLWPRTRVSACNELPDGALGVWLDQGIQFAVDHVVFATGYRVDVAHIPFLDQESISSHLEVRNGFPVLDDRFQSSLPGLYFTSMLAVQDFGPFLGFTVSVRASARIIGRGLREPLRVDA